MGKIRSLLFWCSKVNILKTVYYSLKFRGKVIVGKANIKIKSNSRIIFADDNSIIFLGVNYSYPVPTVLDMYGGTLIIQGKVNLNRGVKVRIYNGGVLTIKDNSYINEGSKVYCSNSIAIGKNCAISFNTVILDSDIHSIYKDGLCVNENKPVEIGDNVWVGANSMVLKGSIINNNVVLGAQSTVRNTLESNQLYAGSPAKAIREIDYWEI